jgi:hypothetical protein
MIWKADLLWVGSYWPELMVLAHQSKCLLAQNWYKLETLAGVLVKSIDLFGYKRHRTNSVEAITKVQIGRPAF